MWKWRMNTAHLLQLSLERCWSKDNEEQVVWKPPQTFNTHDGSLSKILRNIFPFSYQHPVSCEVDLLLLADESTDPGERLWLTVVKHLIGHSPHTPSDVSVCPEWCNKIVEEGCPREEVRRVVWKWTAKGDNSICRNLQIDKMLLQPYYLCI